MEGYLTEIREEKVKQVEKIIADNPMLRSVIQENKKIYDEIKPQSTEIETVGILYKNVGQNNYTTKEEYKKLLKTQINSYEEIEEESKKITGKD